MKLNRVIAIASSVGVVLLALMLVFTSPTEIGPLGVLLFFTTIYVVCFGVVVGLMHLFKRLAFKKLELAHKDYLYSAVLGFAPIMLLMARSFGVLNWLTIGLIAVFITLTEFLVAKSS